ncbi:aminotransferase class III-fold pyridoxal phosphate-dependent enzyme [Lacticaseibacillus zhaodongensis]|uniref:aminotransferase class III-fold pyridoxal phosphate-dependent enzyme n=1 Tax=Lacticaseibacillus zhaodongensis TaxID=2668065 RepID=UPI0012D32B09|nr:aminotransferase class III-fold pyridoxal phosphate-dependent enzyme [Lacticaseibacillus zhaodongensis]
MTKLFTTYKRWPITLVDGQDWHVTDSTGKTYVDLSSGIGVMSLGYHYPAVQDAVEKQVQHIWHNTNLYQSPGEEKVASLLINGLNLPDDYLAFFGNSGTEANEAALKLARRYTGKTRMLNFAGGFHGRTYGSLTVTPIPDIQQGFGVDTSGVKTAKFNDPAAIDELDASFAALIIEAVQGEGGVIPADKAWLQVLCARAHELGVLVIVDEVQSGIGRTGSLFAFQQYGIEPDIITSAKALASGLPVGAMIGKAKLGSAFPYGAHGTTFGGNPIVMASATAVLQSLTPELLEHVQTVGKAAMTELATWTALPAVTEVRGRGLMIGIELSADLDVATVVQQLQEQGLLTLTAKHNTLRLLPPLIISEEALLDALAIIKGVLVADSKQ